MFKRLWQKFKGRDRLDYDQAKRLARHKNAKVRRQLAEREDLPSEILYFLAEDTSPDVRLAIAKNIATPRQADLLLSKDSDVDVRAGLAQKIAKLMPGLDSDELKKVQAVTHQVIDELARDQAVRVRRILSETLKDIANAPPPVIQRLARDVELVVCAPVLECSPVLTDEDLLAIISSDHVRGALVAIAKRRALPQAVTDAISDSDDIEAIGVMLGNASAQIREETLDRLIDRSRSIASWHAPLVNRPQLSRKAVLRLVEFVAENLVDTLVSRADFDPQTAEAVREEFSRRMEAAERVRARDEGGRPEDRVKALHKKGGLDDHAVREAAQSGDEVFVKTALALLSGFKLSVIEKIFDIASAKGVVAVCWKAGLAMPTAVLVQKRIARIAPRDVLGSIDGDYPFRDEEMRWQLEFFADED